MNNIKQPNGENKIFIKKYKAKNINDILTDKYIYNATQKLNKLDECLLFIGNKNCGKTTLMHIFIKDYFKEIKKSIYENEVMIIDNLKDNGVRFFREEMLYFFKSNSGIPQKKRFLLIDDLDELSISCQTILESYIDKFKDKVKIMCFATSLNKITIGLQSRLCIIQMKEPTNEHLLNFINKICNLENIKINDETKQYLLSISNNNFAFIINSLEKLYIYSLNNKQNIDLSKCKDLICIITDNIFDIYFDNIFSGNWKNAIGIINNIYKIGYSVIDIFYSMDNYLKKTDKFDDLTKCKIIKELCLSIKHFYCLHENQIELYLFTYKIYKTLKN